MKIEISAVRMDGAKYIHLPENERPYILNIAVEDNHNTALFSYSNGTAKLFDVTMANGNSYYGADIGGYFVPLNNGYRFKKVKNNKPVSNSPLLHWHTMVDAKSVESDMITVNQLINALDVVPISFWINSKH